MKRVPLGNELKTATGVEVHDILRFFYGNGPAAQFEAGHKQGGTYCCVGCGASSGQTLLTLTGLQSIAYKNDTSLYYKERHGK